MQLNDFDVQRIVTSLPRDVRKLLKESNGAVFLAGGFIRAILSGEQPADIDLWGRDKEELDRHAELFAARRKVRCMSTKNAHTILDLGRTPVQFITRWTFPTPEACAESFDFTIAAACIWYEESPSNVTDASYYSQGQENSSKGGWRSYCGETFYRDLCTKSLVYTSPDRNEDAGGSLLRMQKFIRKGYSISPGNMAAVISRLLCGVRFSNSFCGQEEFRTSVLLGLLREVDPLVVVDGIELPDEVIDEAVPEDNSADFEQLPDEEL